MILGRGRRREHPKDTSKRVTWPSVTTGVAQLPVAHAHIQGNPEGVNWPLVAMLLLRKTPGKSRACVEPTSGQGLFWCPTIIAYYYYGCCQISVTSGSHVTTTKKKTREKRGMRRTYFPVRATSGQATSGQCLFRSRDFLTSGQKATTREDMAQLPVAHAQNILPDSAYDWRYFRYNDFRLLIIAPPQMWLCPCWYTTHYSCILIALCIKTQWIYHSKQTQLFQWLLFNIISTIISLPDMDVLHWYGNILSKLF